jgi:hypothetical protein
MCLRTSKISKLASIVIAFTKFKIISNNPAFVVLKTVVKQPKTEDLPANVTPDVDRCFSKKPPGDLNSLE